MLPTSIERYAVIAEMSSVRLSVRLSDAGIRLLAIMCISAVPRFSEKEVLFIYSSLSVYC